MNRALTYFVCASVLGVASVLSAQEEAANNEAKDSVTELDPALVKAATAKPAAKHFHALVRFVRGNAEVLVKLPRQSEFKPAVEGKFYPTGSTFRTTDGAEFEFGKDAVLKAKGEAFELFTCGPDGLLKAVTERAVAHGVPGWISCDRHMICGVGACYACIQRTVRGNSRCCIEGPVFAAQDLVW